MMGELNKGQALAFVVLVVVSACIWGWIIAGTFGACVVGTTGDTLQKTVSALDSTMDLGIKLSVALIGAVGAVVLGIKSGMRLTPWSKTLLIICAVLFGQSVAAGVYWKLEVADSWLNRCLNLITEPQVRRAFDGSLWFYSTGIFCALVLLFFAAWGAQTTGGRDAP
jgi:hypothetical protein